MRGPNKHLPVDQWPEADSEAFTAAYAPGDVFDESAGPGAHLAERTRRTIGTSYARWLQFLKANHPEALSLPPADRITPERVRGFVDRLSDETRASSVALYAHNFYQAAHLIAPTADWAWLWSLKSRLLSRFQPEDRFDRLVSPWGTLDLGIELMEETLKLPVTGHKRREIQYRDGLFIALLSVWPIRRRSLAALTVSRHLELDDLGVNILLYPSDTKAKRAESLRVPEELLPYLRRYLEEIRPRPLGRRHHDGLWASFQGRPLSEGRLYDIARARVFHRFGKLMGLHDFRRAAATFLAMDAPEMIGLIPGVLQHSSPDVSEQHYNLARSMQAGHRFAAHLSENRSKLRSVLSSSEG